MPLDALDTLDFRLTSALIAAAVSIVLFSANRVLVARQSARDKRRAERRFAAALAAEIRYNVVDLQRFSAESASLDSVAAHIRTHKTPPHVTDTKHTRIYTENIDKLVSFETATITALVTFYSQLDKLENEIAGLQLPSFAGISEAGKINTISYIVEVAKAAETSGVTAEKHVAQEIAAREERTGWAAPQALSGVRQRPSNRD